MMVYDLDAEGNMIVPLDRIHVRWYCHKCERVHQVPLSELIDCTPPKPCSCVISNPHEMEVYSTALVEN